MTHTAMPHPRLYDPKVQRAIQHSYAQRAAKRNRQAVLRELGGGVSLSFPELREATGLLAGDLGKALDDLRRFELVEEIDGPKYQMVLRSEPEG